MRSNKGNGINRWWRVVGGLSMNMELGTLLCAWSVFVAPPEQRFGWTRADTSMVFTIAVIVFALSFVLAGRIQDRYGPLPCSLIGGILVSLGFYLCAYTTCLNYRFLYFGVIGGLGNGCGYATPIPVMAKWFTDRRRLASTFQILGAELSVMTMVGAVLPRNPPAGHRPDVRVESCE